jgi:hypothetical protein
MEDSPQPTSAPTVADGKKRHDIQQLNLTLDNFDGDDIPDDYPYVLTSPRSLAACKHFGVRVSAIDIYDMCTRIAGASAEMVGLFYITIGKKKTFIT